MMKYNIVVLTGTTVRITHPSSPNHNMVNHISEEEGVEIADWCNQNKCGHRTAFNIFEFRSKEELTMFMLRWAR